MSRTARDRAFAKLAPVCLILAYAGVRLLFIDRLVTTDEPAWLGASANFYRALVTGEFAHTFNLEHPGVPTMWAGALAYWIRFPEYASMIDHNLDGLRGMNSIESVLRGVGQDPLAILVTAKTIKVLLQTAFFAIAIWCLRKTVEATISYTAATLIVFGPFLTGLDSALHVDGMAAITTFAGFCAIVLATERTNLRAIAAKPIAMWALAGMLCATAWLSRYPALMLLGVVGLGLLFQLFAQRNTALHETTSSCVRSGSKAAGLPPDDLAKGRQAPLLPKHARPRITTLIRTSLVYGMTWSVSGIISTVALWPALWSAPRTTLTEMWRYSAEAANQGHENPLIFMGVIKRGNPGWLFYPVSLLWRMSITDWIGLVALLLLAFWAWRRRHLTSTHVRVIVLATAYIAVFTVAHSFGAKKFDRYILPVYPLITLVASIGLDILGRGIVDLTGHRRLRLAPISLAVVMNIAIIGSIMPYRLDYFSPIMGGPQAAVTNMQMGWGQGGDQVVNFLEHQIDSESLNVQTSAAPYPFTYFLSDDSPIQFHKFDLMTPAGWYETDYYVMALQQTQRNLAPDYDVLRDYPRAFTVEIGGVPYFEVFDVRNLPIPESLKAPTACNYRFGEQIQLMQIIGRDPTIDLYFLSLDGSEVDPITLTFTLTNPDGSYRVDQTTVIPTATNTMMRATIANPANGTDTPLRDVNIMISASRNGEPLPVTAPWQSSPIPAATMQSECYHTAPP